MDYDSFQATEKTEVTHDGELSANYADILPMPIKSAQWHEIQKSNSTPIDALGFPRPDAVLNFDGVDPRKPASNAAGDLPLNGPREKKRDGSGPSDDHVPSKASENGENGLLFKSRWNEASEALAGTPLAPLMKELGEQLASGKLDEKRLEKLLKDAKFSEEDLAKVMTAFNRFKQEMNDTYGINVDLNLKGKQNTVSVESVKVSVGSINPTAITIASSGKATASQSGVGQTNEVPVTDAMQKFKERIGFKPRIESHKK